MQVLRSRRPGASSASNHEGRWGAAGAIGSDAPGAPTAGGDAGAWDAGESFMLSE